MMPEEDEKIREYVMGYLSYVTDALYDLETISAFEVSDNNAIKYFGNRITVFHNDVVFANTITEKVYVISNIDELMEEMKEKIEDVRFALDVAYAYIKCGGD